MHIFKNKSFSMNIIYCNTFNTLAARMNFSFALVTPYTPVMGIHHHTVAVAMRLSVMLQGMLFLLLATALFAALKADPE